MKQLLNGKEYTKGGVVRRLSWYIDEAGPKERAGGENWYYTAHMEAHFLANEYGYHPMQTAAVIAALSPQKNWQENLKISDLFFQGVTNTHYQAQISKAIDCSLSTPDAAKMFSTVSKGGMKTSHFFMNIWNPHNPDYVTIDRHAIAACVCPGSKIETLPDSDRRLTKKQYDFIVDCYKSVAKKHGILPNQAQAIVWTVLRRLKGLPTKYKTS